MSLKFLQKIGVATTFAVAAIAGLAPVATAQVQRSILNEGFEVPPLSSGDAGCNLQTSSENIVGWQTDHSPRSGRGGCTGVPRTEGPLIELWRAPLPGVTGLPSGNVLAHEGRQYAELNAEEASRLYQSICIVEGETFAWRFSHRGRAGGGDTQSMAFGISTDPSGRDADAIFTSSVSPAEGWVTRRGVYEHTGPSGVQNIGFRATNGRTVGNFLDAIQISLTPYIEFQPADRAAPESEARDGLPMIRIAGRLTAPLTIALRITGGTAELGRDFTTPTGSTTFSVVIPAGNYDGTQDIPTGVVILEDLEIEGNETITMQIIPDRAAFTIANVEICGAQPRGAMTYTIEDNDAALSLTKALPDGRNAADDQFALAIDGINGARLTTTGTNTQADGEIRLTDVVIGTDYTFSEGMGAGSSGDFNRYIPALTCTNANTASTTILPGGTGDSGTLTPHAGDDIACVFTNSIRPSPSLGVVKLIDPARPVVTPATVGTVIPYLVRVTNTGNVALSNLAMEDRLTQVSAAGDVDTAITLSGPTGDLGSDGLLSPAEIWTYGYDHVVTQADIDAGLLSNSATATAQDPDGNPVSDISGSNINIDNPTLFTLTRNPEMRIVKEVVTPVPSATAWPANEGDAVTFRVSVINTGNVTLRDVELTEDLRRLDGVIITPAPALVPEHVVTGPDGVLPVGTSWTYLVTHEVTLADIAAGGVSNTVIGSARSPADSAGDPPSINDISGPDRDSDAPVLVPIANVPVFSSAKTAGEMISLGGGRYELPFTITVQNDGPVAIRNLQIADDLTAMLGEATLVALRDLEVTGARSGGANPAYDGVNVTRLLQTDTSVAGMDQLVIRFAVVFDTASGAPDTENIADITSDRSPAQQVTAPIPPIVPPAITASKTADTDTAIIGQTITYTLTYTNAGSTLQRDLRLVDSLPEGLALVPDTVTLDGAAVSPNVAGARVTIPLAELAPAAQAVVALQARVTTLSESLTNRTWVEDVAGSIISDIASYTITPRIEAVFQCSDVIGRVFDDRNLNGYLDRASDTGSVISDQSYAPAKWEIDPQAEAGLVAQGLAEQGLAGIRLFTPTGTVITTDAFGRFSVPCAALPAETGENFTLRLDESSLPSGYRVTSENPRTIRLSQGTMGWMEFGAALGRVMEIDLTAAAFVAGEPRPELVAGIEGLIAQIAQAPIMLRLNYYATPEGEATARAHLDAVELLMRRLWSDQGSYRLLIERQIARLQ